MTDKRWQYLGAVALTIAAVGLKLFGQPGLDQRWQRIAKEYQPLLDERKVFIEPAELVTLMHNHAITLLMADVRREADYNVYHLTDSRNISMDELPRFAWSALPDNAVIVLMSNDERLAASAWQRLKVLQVGNAYVLEGGLNHWLDVYGHAEGHERCIPASQRTGDETPAHRFAGALGARQASSHPNLEEVSAHAFTPKVQLKTAGRKSGGCG